MQWTRTEETGEVGGRRPGKRAAGGGAVDTDRGDGTVPGVVSQCIANDPPQPLNDGTKKTTNKCTCVQTHTHTHTRTHAHTCTHAHTQSGE